MTQIRRSRIASYQCQSRFELLEKEPSGTFKYRWWAIVDGLATFFTTA
jgi:hypothetical protein